MDPCSSANPSESFITHIDLFSTCDMRSPILFGRATYSYLSHHSNLIILDTNHLEILESSNPYSFASEDPVYGKPLHIFLSSNSGSFSLKFKTTQKSSAIQYLLPSQTSSKTHAFCYTQCQAIHCRTLLPVQDTPQVKFTINYKIAVPENYRAVAAGNFIKIDQTIPGFKIFEFAQNIRIPSYLVAFAVGNISSHLVKTPRFTVYAEPELLDSAVEEFSELEKMLETAEETIIPYSWGTLNLLVLPPSFPYGGMENPNLIFVTPTLIVGDKSMTNIIVHEIAHSWTGNGVTNSTWEHFWLNEGFAVYLERKITAKLWGIEVAQMEMANSITVLRKTVEQFGTGHNFTRLNLDIAGIDPDDAFSRIPYDKGCVFLCYLESLVGEAAFLQFVREYISEFTGKVCDSSGFQEFFSKRFMIDLDWNTWLRGTGMPPWLPELSNSLLDSVHEVYNQLTQDSNGLPPITNWCKDQKLALLDLFLQNPQVHHIHICEAYCFHIARNHEIKERWLILVIKLKCKKYYKEIEEFLCSVGRLKHVRLIFRALHDDGLNEIADLVFEKCKNFYHSTLVELLCKEFKYKCD